MKTNTKMNMNDKKKKNKKKIAAVKPIIRLSILVSGGILQEIRANKSGADIQIDLFDLDNNPELEEDYEEATRGQAEINF